MNVSATTAQARVSDLTHWLACLGAYFSGPADEAARRGSLDSSSFARVASPRGQRVTCLTGVLWLTFDGVSQDVVLEAGQSLVCEHDASLLIAAFGQATWQADPANRSAGMAGTAAARRGA